MSRSLHSNARPRGVPLMSRGYAGNRSLTFLCVLLSDLEPSGRRQTTVRELKVGHDARHVPEAAAAITSHPLNTAHGGEMRPYLGKKH